MKRLILSALALSMLAVPAAQAAERHGSREEYRKVQKYHAPKHDSRHFDRRDSRHVERKEVIRRGDKVVVRKVERHRWVKGHRVPEWQRKHVVRDYGRYGLHRPGPGQRWVKVDNDYLLIGITSGIIAGLIAGR
ncbi:RcnB family protein [Kumtagia ephedrae]|jgi:Ni/Co efflux regulator RcnB|uniref:Integral membrane-like protein n=1 Tax=Kumtagia ephedrae TaxID=2116701 RepID=A0A2P7SDC6_9HYPH|nr:RcnB family protein [Mesorhizobium ephedrae]PSJ60504.1 hypothetical protein C7I84_11020 [Mesorhizobium ephedrae]